MFLQGANSVDPTAMKPEARIYDVGAGIVRLRKDNSGGKYSCFWTALLDCSKDPWGNELVRSLHEVPMTQPQVSKKLKVCVGDVGALRN